MVGYTLRTSIFHLRTKQELRLNVVLRIHFESCVTNGVWVHIGSLLPILLIYVNIKQRFSKTCSMKSRWVYMASNIDY
jgi:hypothetical protein